MKDLSPLHYFMGIEIAYGPRGYLLSQKKYNDDLISRAELSDDVTTNTPMQLRQEVTPDMGETLANPTRYHKLVGALIYLTISQSDIVYMVHIVSQFVQAPISAHYIALLHIIKYLRGIITQLLSFHSSSLELRAYFDVDQTKDPISNHCMTGFYIILEDSLISWQTKKQDMISKFGSESEYWVVSSTMPSSLTLESSSRQECLFSHSTATIQS